MKMDYEIIEKEKDVFYIRDAKSKNIYDLGKRVFEFAVAIIELLKTVPYSKENDVIRYQIAKAGTSVGANYEEAQATRSRADFSHKIAIVLRETRESNYWLRIMKRTKIGNQTKVEKLVRESFELKCIFGNIYGKVTK